MYAECSASALTGEKSNASDSNLTVETTNGVTTATGTVKLTQAKDGWNDGKDVNIGGVSVKSSDITAGGTIEVTVTSDGTTTIAPKAGN